MPIRINNFFIGFLAATFIAIVWLNTRGISSWRDDLMPLQFRVKGEAPGLKPGGKVRFEGIPIGFIDEVSQDYSDLEHVIISSLVDDAAPIRASTQAELTFDRLGQWAIDMQGGSLTDPLVFSLAKESGSTVSYDAKLSKSWVFTKLPPDRSFGGWLSERNSAELVALIAVSCVVLWTAGMIFLFCVKPNWIIALHEKMPEQAKINNEATLFDRASFGAAAITCWAISTLLLFLASRPRALDAWVDENLVEARLIFEQHPSVRDRRIALDLPVRIETVRYKEPWTEIRQLVSGSSPTAIMISGPGGTGKTTLALEFARRALHTTEGQQLGRHPMVPLLIESDVPDEVASAGDLVLYLAGMLRTSVNAKHRITVRLTSALLRAGRILLVVDGLSERSSATRGAINPQRQGFEPLRLVVASRDRIMPGMNTLIETESIPAGELFDFISCYLKEMEDGIEVALPTEEQIFEACAQLKHLLGETPCTPLLATMWAEEIRVSQDGDYPHGVASLMDNYVRRLLLPATHGNEIMVSQLAKDAAKIAEYELGENYQPGFVTRAAALEVLRKLNSEDPEKRFAIMERSRILESPSQSDFLRISPDPIAEHLVSRLKCEELGSDEKSWRDLLDALRLLRLPYGFTMSLAACADDEVHGRRIPRSIRDQIQKLRVEVAEAQSTA